MTEDPETVDNQVTPEQPASDMEPAQSPEEKVTMSDLRQDLATEEAAIEPAPVKTGFLRKMTGFLRPKTGVIKKTKEPAFAPSEEPQIPEKEIPFAEMPPSEAPLTEPETIDSALTETDSVTKGVEPSTDGDQTTSPESESSIFDLLYQVRQSGLGEEPLTSSSSKPAFVTRPLAEKPPELEKAVEEAEESTIPTDTTMTTSSLASRLWGLDEQARKEEELEAGDETSQAEGTAPFLEENKEEKTSKGDETEGKPGFFDRLKTSRGEDRNTRPIAFDDNIFTDRVARMTGELHEPPERIPPAQSPLINATREMGHEEVDEAGGRFVFYPQEPEQEIPSAIQPEGEDHGPSPFVVEEPGENAPASEEQGKDVEPFTVTGEEWAAKVESQPGEGQPGNLDEFLSDQQPQASTKNASLEGQPPPGAGIGSASTFERMDYSTWGGAYPEITEQPVYSEDERVSPQDSPEKIRSIALGPDLENLQNPESAAGMSTDQAEEVAYPRRRRSWWKSLPGFERALLVFVGVLVVALGGIAYLSAHNFWQQAPPVVVQPTITPSALPQPVKVVLPGAWSFSLSSSALAVNPDTPGAGIWLMGSEVRRVIELPWNKQTEAVIQTFTPGDLIQVFFEDDTIMNYKVDQILRVSVSDTSVLTDNQPSLVIILAGEKDPDRWVVVARP